MAVESCSGSFQVWDLVKKKKKKRRLDRETPGQHVGTGFRSPLSSDCSFFSWHFDDQASESSETPQKKSTKKARQERSDSQLDYSCIVTESQLTDKAGTGVCKPKKKKRRKLGPGEQDDGDPLCVPLSPGKTSNQPKADHLGNGDCTDGGTPVKKKTPKAVVANQDEDRKLSSGPSKNRTDSTSSDKHEEASCSSAKDSQVELFTFLPCKTQHLSPSQEKAATKLATPTKLSSFVAPSKPHKHKKSSGVEDSDNTDVAPRKPRKHKRSSGVEDSDTTDNSPRKPHKHKKASGIKNSTTDVAPRKPHKHKTSSDVEDSDTTNVTPRKPRKHKTSSGVEDSDTTDVAPRKPHKHKRSSGVEDSDTTNVAPRKPHKHKKTSGVEDSDTTDVTPRKPPKHKTSSGVEDSDTTDVTPRKPPKHKKASSIKNSTTDVAPRKPHKHKTSSDVEDSDTTNVTPRKPRKHKTSSGVEDSDTTDVAPRKPRKHKKASGIKNSTTDVAPRKPHKHKRSSGVEDSDTTDVAPRKPHKHKRSSGVEDSDTTDVAPRKPHKHKKTSGVEDSDTTDVTPRKPPKHKKSCNVKDSDTTDVTPRKPPKHKKSSGVEDFDTTDLIPRKPHKHKKASGVKNSNSTDVTPRKPCKHKTSSGMEDSDSSGVGFEVEETVKSVTNLDQIKNHSQAKRFPLEDSNELPEILEDVQKLSSPEHSASQSFFIEDNEFLDPAEFVVPDLDTATQELEEFIPHVRNLSASAIQQLARRDLVRFKNFKQKGIAVKFGRFTKKEDDQLRKNVEAFLNETRIESAERLLFVHRFPEERAAISRLKTQHLFGIRIAEGIPRPWRLVYYRARKIFDPHNYNGRFSEKEKKKLLKYQAQYGNNWRKISGLMSRSSHSVAMKYSQIKSNPNSGPWSKEETKRLIQAVEEVLLENHKEFDSAMKEDDEGKALSLMREDLYKGISWTKVEARVGTRHWRQCKHKWISVVTKRMSGGRVMTRRKQNLQLKVNLIERLYEMNVEDANEIDWEVLSSFIGDVPPYYIQKRFCRLKVAHVPFWNRKTFPEIIDHLYGKTRPKLTALLKTEKKAQSTQAREQRKVFQFQEIFRESSDELIDKSESEDE